MKVEKEIFIRFITERGGIAEESCILCGTEGFHDSLKHKSECPIGLNAEFVYVTPAPRSPIVIDEKITPEGKKNDQDLYKKVDYSLIPLNLITEYLKKFSDKLIIVDLIKSEDYGFFKSIHNILNKKAPTLATSVILKEAIEYYGIESLATSLGMGFSKYKQRHNWKRFNDNPDRFLRAALRHLMAIITGANYDHEKGIDGYDKGNDHRGAVCFSLMVADNILHNKPDGTTEEQIRKMWSGAE